MWHGCVFLLCFIAVPNFLADMIVEATIADFFQTTYTRVLTGNSNFFTVKEKIESTSATRVSHLVYPSIPGIAFSTPEECARTCRDDEPPKICYYHFNLEHHTVLGEPCQKCIPNAVNRSSCECILADGVERGILTANKMLPGPDIQVCEGDKIVIDVDNHMKNMDGTIHAHGILQKGHPYYDGVSYITQCPVLEGDSFRYKWTAGNPGTHFWYSHTGFQRMDGLYGSLIVRQPPFEDPNSNLYDYDQTDHIIVINDWLHDYATTKYPERLPVSNLPLPATVLINGKGQLRDPYTGLMINTHLEVFTIKPGSRYRFRLINAFAHICPAQISFQAHRLTVIAADGKPVQPVTVDTIISYAGERYDFVVNADQHVDAYWIQVQALGSCSHNRIQNFAILRYADTPYQPKFSAPIYDVDTSQGTVLNPLDVVCNVPRDDAVCASQLKNAGHINEEIIKQQPDVKIFLPFQFTVEIDSMSSTFHHFMYGPEGDVKVALVDGVSFVYPEVPPLSQIDDISPEQFCNGTNRPENRLCTQKVDVPHNAIVEIILVNQVQQPKNASHPFHLHGHEFMVLGMEHFPDIIIDVEYVLDLDRRGLLRRDFDRPHARDTIAIPNNGYAVVRFHADNPGYWLLHCSFVTHIQIGMDIIVHVGTHDDLSPIPPDFPTCGSALQSH